mgnify:CR=1 FL=1
MNKLNLEYYNVKDFSRDDCEHCGVKYLQTCDIGNGLQFKKKIQCESCVQAERTIEQIHGVMRRTNDKLAGTNNVQEIAEFKDLIQLQKQKLNIVLTTIRNYTQERHRKTNEPVEYPRPYKD